MNTVSLQLAQELRKAGFPQETEFWWKVWPISGAAHIEFGGKEYWKETGWDIWAAPTAEEILERLPIQLKTKEFLSIQKFNTYWVGYGVGTKIYKHFDSESLAEAAGKMYLYLSKEGLLPKKTE